MVLLVLGALGAFDRPSARFFFQEGMFLKQRVSSVVNELAGFSPPPGHRPYLITIADTESLGYFLIRASWRLRFLPYSSGNVPRLAGRFLSPLSTL